MMWKSNTSFLAEVPVQFAWDSTSIGTFKRCPKLYYWTMVLGLQSSQESVHLKFGLVYHKALETFDHFRSRGATWEEARLAAIRCCLEETWDATLNRPWQSFDPNKNRRTLVRTVVWYLEQFREDSITTIQLANGKPAVELSFRFEIDRKTLDGSRNLLCGHFDRFGIFCDQPYVIDRKTTKHALNDQYFAGYTPHNQFSLYTFAGQHVYKVPVKGVIVDAAQILVNSSVFARREVCRTEAELEEWYKDLGMFLDFAESCAVENHWPKNENACGDFGGCSFRELCSVAPNLAKHLTGKWKRRAWDPLVARGDI